MTTIYYLLLKRFEQAEGGIEALRKKTIESAKSIKPEGKVASPPRQAEKAAPPAPPSPPSIDAPCKPSSLNLSTLSKLVSKKKAALKRKQRGDGHESFGSFGGREREEVKDIFYKDRQADDKHE